MVKVALVPPTTDEKLAPWSVETFHCTVGAGNPLAAAEKVALCGVTTDLLVGSMVTVGAVLGTVTMAKPDEDPGSGARLFTVLPGGSDTGPGTRSLPMVPSPNSPVSPYPQA